MKYICFMNEDGKEEIITFPNSINHDVMAVTSRRMKDKLSGDWKRVCRLPISAGFVTYKNECHGESITLDLKARPSLDTQLLKEQY